MFGFQEDESKAIRCVRDVGYLSTPSLWVGKEPGKVAELMADALIRMLGCRFVFAGLIGKPDEGFAFSAARASDPADADRMTEQLTAALVASEPDEEGFLPCLFGRRDLRATVFPVGPEGKLGVVAVVCVQPGFPDEIDRLLVNVCANHGAAALQNFHLIEATHARKLVDEDRQKFAFLAENSLDCICMASLDGKVLYMNPSGCRLLGISGTREAAALTLAGLFPAELGPALEKTVLPAAKELGQWEGEMPFRHFLTGRPLDAVHSLFLVRGQQEGEPVCLALVSRDLTERKRAEAALKSTQNQLLQSQKMEAVGKLAGGIAHDFNNLLTAINGYAELSLAMADPELPLRSNLEEIKAAGERGAALTRQLLAYSRKQVLLPKVLNVNNVVRDMCPMLTRLIGEDIDLARILDPNLGFIKADPGQMEQVIVSLVVNARDALPQGGKIVIETQNAELDEYATAFLPEARPGSYVMLAVSDNGCGMDEQTKARVFEPFFTTKEFGKGAGMGLAMVHGIVSQSGGHIFVYSQPGQGSAFKIYLPAAGAPAAEAGPGAEAREKRPAGPRGKETVLVAEDEENVRKFTRRILEANGYRVLEAGDGEAAFQMAEADPGPIDLLLTDVVMPRMNGRELAERLTRSRPGLGVLFMSGYTDDAIVRHGLMMEPSTHFIQKPFLPAMLAKAVREILNSQRKAVRARAPQGQSGAAV